MYIKKNLTTKLNGDSPFCCLVRFHIVKMGDLALFFYAGFSALCGANQLHTSDI